VTEISGDISEIHLLNVIPSPSASLRINFVDESRFPFAKPFAVQKRDPSSLYLFPNSESFFEPLLRMTLRMFATLAEASVEIHLMNFPQNHID